jgi:hypothetical protein
MARRREAFNGVIASGEDFRAYIAIDHKCIFLGKFDTPEDASTAYNAASRTLRAAYQTISRTATSQPQRKRRLVTA